MSADNKFLLQEQVRNNSEDLQQYLKDMDNWEKEMKKKEKELQLMQVTDDQAVPPIRNSFSRTKKVNKLTKQKKEKEKSSSSPKKRLSGYDYKSWDKFDVESELKKIDVKESSTSESSDSDQEFNHQQRKQLAITKKDKGNAFFKKGQYDSAINSYTIGIELDPDNALLYANRAMAFLKKEQFQAAEDDCNLCLSLDSKYIKAYLRRGSARKSLCKLPKAKEDFQKVLELEPENKQAQEELKWLDTEIRKSISSTLEELSEPPDEHEVKIDEGSQRRKIIDISVDNNCSLPQETKSLHTKFGDETVHKKILDKEIVEKSDTEVCLESPVKNSSCLKTGNTKGSSGVKMDSSLVDLQKVITALELRLPPVPTASFQFLTDWKKISKHREMKYQYLKQFPPNKFPVLFKNYIEPEIFPEILNTLSTSFIENNDDVFIYMKYLASVGRFNTMIMFLSESEEKDLFKLKNYLEKSSNDPSEVKDVLKLYDVL